MKIRNDRYKNQSDFEGRTGSASLDMSRLSLFIDHMISNYNYPELATLREWVSNAHDAHVEAGVTTPVEVTLPTALNPILMVKDNGAGMTSDFVENKYLTLGHSPKDESDEVIGGFGIGGKSALAISSQYTMTTIANGLKSIYIMERSPRGGMDFKAPVVDVPTDEPSGVTVQVAIDRVEQFSETNINRVLAGWSNKQVKLTNGKEFFSIPDSCAELQLELEVHTDVADVEPGAVSTTTTTLNRRGYVLENAFTSGNRVRNDDIIRKLDLRYGQVVIMVGPVAYVFDSGANLVTPTDMRGYIAVGLEIGDVTFPSSREVIEASRTNLALIKQALTAASNAAFEEFKRRAGAMRSYEEAYNYARSRLAKAAQYAGVGGRDKITYKGETVPTTFTVDADNDGLFHYEAFSSWSNKAGDYRLVEKQLKGLSSARGTTLNFDLNIATLVIRDDESTEQSIRNNVRLYNSEQAGFNHQNGYLFITKEPSVWVKAAARTVLTSSELSEKAKIIRKKHRDAKAAGGPAPAPAPKRTRKDMIGEYRVLTVFTAEEDGQTVLQNERMDLAEFVQNHFDETKTLLMTTNATADGYKLESIVSVFRNFKVYPTDFQLLHVNSGAKEKTLRILLGDKVKIMTPTDWMKEHLVQRAKVSATIPDTKSLAAKLPFEFSYNIEALFSSLGYDTLHEKYKELFLIKEELEEARAVFRRMNNGYSIGYFVRQLFSANSDYRFTRVATRPEFHFLEHYSGHRSIDEASKPVLRHMLNHFMRTWLNNVALEEAEALEERELQESRQQAQQEKTAALS